VTESRGGVIYLNGRMVASEDAAVSVFDHGLLYGDGVFDTMFAMHGWVFKLEAHVNRLYRSLHAVRLDLPMSREEMTDAILTTVRANGLRDAYIKVVVTRGVGPEPLMDPRGCTPTMIIFVRPYLSLASGAERARGLRMKIASIRRVSTQALEPRIKSLNYLNLVLAKIEALDSGYDEALLADENGFVCEAPGYNVFALIRGAVVTPDLGALEGVTRETVMELCETLGTRCVIRTVAPYDLFTASEVFLSSTAAGLIPVAEIDGHRIGTGAPGPFYERLVKAYDDMIQSGANGTRI
jgi:branched-chain amino acid aminotransferase